MTYIVLYAVKTAGLERVYNKPLQKAIIRDAYEGFLNAALGRVSAILVGN